MLNDYQTHVAERAALGIPPLALDAKQVAGLIELIKNPPAGEEALLMDLLTHRVPPGVDDAAKVKASCLAAVAHGDVQVALISKARATELLGTMVGGYNVHPLIELLDDADVAGVAAEALKKTLNQYGAPEIFNSDQGCQFTSEAFTEVLKQWQVRISMDGKGRFKDNIFIERLWRTLKYERIYVKSYETGTELAKDLTDWFSWYNERRKHTSLDKQTPDAVYYRALEHLRLAA